MYTYFSNKKTNTSRQITKSTSTIIELLSTYTTTPHTPDYSQSDTVVL